MDAEPSNWELARQLADIKQMLVGHPEYGADKRALDWRLSELERDRDTERRERVEDIRAVNQRITDQARAGAEHKQHWRSLLWTGALPATVALLSVLVTLWIAHHGGK